MPECDPHDGRAVATNHDLGVERRVTNLTDAEDIAPGSGGSERECARRVGELAPAIRAQTHDAEAERFTGFGADDGAAK